MIFDEAIISYDFIKNEDESCVYKKMRGSAITFMVLYVDDILLIWNNARMFLSMKVWLSKNLSMEDLEAICVLGIHIYKIDLRDYSNYPDPHTYTPLSKGLTWRTLRKVS